MRIAYARNTCSSSLLSSTKNCTRDTSTARACTKTPRSLLSHVYRIIVRGHTTRALTTPSSLTNPPPQPSLGTEHLFSSSVCHALHPHWQLSRYRMCPPRPAPRVGLAHRSPRAQAVGTRTYARHVRLLPRRRHAGFWGR